MKKKIKKIVSLIKFPSKSYNKIPLCYFNERPNVGDALNEDLIKFITGKEVIKVPSVKLYKHMCAVGSIISAMTNKSTVWGSGLISETAIDNIKEIGDIRAVRGYLTKNKLEEKFGIKLDVPLGDPALLMPLVYEANKEKKYEFGLVLHYVDESHPIKNVVEEMGGRIINVGLPVKNFINEINKCDKILSSSMHGLILADTYNIPNTRLILSDKIVGGDFKFKDYYSTTNSINDLGVKISTGVDNVMLINILKLATVKKTILDLNLLLKAFPKDKY